MPESQTKLAQDYFHYANSLIKLGQLEAAIVSYDRAIAIKPDFVDAHVNRGSAWLELKQFRKAIESYDCAINIDANHVLAYVNRGLAFVECRQLDAAIVSYEQAIAINPHFDYLLGTLIHTKMKLCDWTDFEKHVSELMKRIERNEKSSICFHGLPLINSASAQREVAEIFSKDKHPFNNLLGDIPQYSRSEKIRIGYFSADFYFHPVSLLMAEIFELHDKNNFELIAFSFGPDIKDAMRGRIEKAFDQFIDIRHLQDKEAAQLARQMKIDIAIDLGGNTANSRTGIFSYRAAPVQVNYLGFPGTMGADYFDYLIADQTLIPIQSQKHYVEKIVYMPNSYQANDTKRNISDKKFSRLELGLPEVGFIFCCFNNNYKITPDTFDSWMRILKAVPNSVLLLYAGSENAEENLRKEAEIRGVDQDRLVFGTYLPSNEYLARYQVADLFLNTFPYNAGTTASDALWAGLPLLTLCGETFVSRVAASLLKAIDLPELVTHTQDQYETLAIELATRPDKLNRIKTKLATNKLTTPLFDTTLFTGHIESAYTQMVERHLADLAPDHIYVQESLNA